MNDDALFASALRSLPANPDLDHLRNEAKQRLKARRRTDPDARLASMQLRVAREHGFASWRRLKAHIEAARGLDELPAPWAVDVFGRLKPFVERGDFDGMDRLIQDMLRLYPDDDELLALRANMLARYGDDPDGARAIYADLLQRPTASILTQYAHHLRHTERHVASDDVEAFHLRALRLGKGTPAELGFALDSYAWFLKTVRRDLDGAERQLHRAAELECGYPRANANHLGSFAKFLWDHRWDARRAEPYFRRSRAFSTKEAESRSRSPPC